MIKKTTTFTLGMLFSLGLCTLSMPLQAGLLSRSNTGADIIETLHKGFKGILSGETTADAVLKELTKIDPKVGELIEALLEFLRKEFKNDPTLMHDKERSGPMIEDFCINYFKKKGAKYIIQSIQYTGILQKLKEEFAVYTPEEFNIVIQTLHASYPLLSDEDMDKAIIGASQSLEIVRKDR